MTNWFNEAMFSLGRYDIYIISLTAEEHTRGVIFGIRSHSYNKQLQ